MSQLEEIIEVSQEKFPGQEIFIFCSFITLCTWIAGSFLSINAFYTLEKAFRDQYQPTTSWNLNFKNFATECQHESLLLGVILNFICNIVLAVGQLRQNCFCLQHWIIVNAFLLCLRTFSLNYQPSWNHFYLNVLLFLRILSVYQVTLYYESYNKI